VYWASCQQAVFVYSAFVLGTLVAEPPSNPFMPSVAHIGANTTVDVSELPDVADV
jgi:hypothetical protein